VIETEVDEALSLHAVNDVKAIEQHGLQFRQPPQLVAEGFLGDHGAAKLCELPSPEEQEAQGTGSSLLLADNALTELGSTLELSMEEEMGVNLMGRTTAVLLQTGEPGVMQPDLTDQDAQRWLGTFAKAKIMVLMFLGPSEGSLELQAFGEEDVEPFRIATRPGMTVVLRADVLLREYQGAESYILTSFFLAATQAWFKDKPVTKLHPAAQAIDQWVCDRMVALKSRTDPEEESALAPSIPREFQRIMNRQLIKGERTAIKGTACKHGCSHGLDVFHRSLVSGVDYAEEVPFSRWDHTEKYNPDMESYQWEQVYCLHMTVVPDLDLFDNKFFLLSVAESSRMDICERQFLEVGYETLANAGLNKRQLMGGDCGVYVGWQSEMQTIEDRGMGANRFSFCLGCKGPSLSCDVDHASCLVAVKVASNELGRACSQGLAMGCSFCLSPHYWVVHCGAHMMSPAGRCFSFDANASGFIRGDCVAGAYVKRLTKEVNGKDIWDEAGHVDGVLCAAAVKNQGQTASLRAVSGPCLQEVFMESLRQAKISPLDVDVVECDAKGDPMNDGIEVCSSVRALRPFSDCEPVAIGCAKTNVGNGWPAAGMVTLMKALGVGLYGYVVPHVHLKQVNPYAVTEVFEKGVLIPDECLDLHSDNSYTALTGCGWGGTNSQLLLWNRVDAKRISLGKPEEAQKIVFWPGGGGFLDKDQTPKRQYSIVGTWSSWSGPQAMEDEGGGTYGFTLTLGENCWELFQIWLDGDEAHVLHPGFGKAAKDLPVQGPSSVGVHYNWMIDGRPRFAAQEEFNEEDASGGEIVPGGEIEHADRGEPGTKYRVRLVVKGKWRTVSWERLAGSSPAPKALSYSVTGNFNYWSFQEMSQGSSPGEYRTEVTLNRNCTDFQIVRNEDWMQVMYPDVPGSSGREGEQVMGPDDESMGSSWRIYGNAGDVFSITFRRTSDGSGLNEMQLSVTSLGNRPTQVAPVKYFLVGSWDGFRSRKEMTLSANENVYEADVFMGTDFEMQFQVLVDGNFSAVLHPNIEDANPYTEHGLMGPSAWSPFCWNIGKDPSDAAAIGKSYTIRLIMNGRGHPAQIVWQDDSALTSGVITERGGEGEEG
jgi:polyketide synthase-associated protein